MKLSEVTVFRNYEPYIGKCIYNVSGMFVIDI